MENQSILYKKVHKKIAIWLFICCGITFSIIVLGGATRLTHSGLSMVKLRVLVGVIPPLGQEKWNERFEEYKKSLEYEKTYKQRGMPLNQFKSIFWLEYLHRLVGRVLASLVFFIPFLYFLIRYFFIKKVINKSLVFKLIIMFILGGLQAVLGWVMVKSGMDSSLAYTEGERIHVNPYRLTAHLTFAFIIYAYILWIALGLWFSKTKFSNTELNSPTGIRRFSLIITGLIFLTVIAGGFVAGTKAGQVYQSFPLMNGTIIPPDLISPDFSLISNFFENKTATQFNHRVLAIFLFITTIFYWVISKRYRLPKRIKSLLHLMLIMIIIQFTLGIMTLLIFVPNETTTIVLGSAHQAGALILFTLSIFINYDFIRNKPN